MRVASKSLVQISAPSTVVSYDPARSDALRWVLEVACVSTAYYVTGRFGLSLGLTTRQITAVWAPTGISLAAVLLLGYRIWPAIALGAFAVNAVSAEPLSTAALISIGNTLEGVTGAFLLRRLIGFDPRLQRIRDVVGLAILGGLVCTTVSATIGTSSLRIAGLPSAESLRQAWLKWWLGDATGALVVAPILLTWGSRPLFTALKGRLFEVALVVIGLAVASWLIFDMPGEQALRLKFLVFPFFVWAGLRFEQRITAAMITLVAVIAIAGATRRTTVFEPAMLDSYLLVLQTFTGVLCVTALSLGAAIAERRRVEEERQELLCRECTAREESQRLLAELAAYRDRLEQLVAERTEALTESMEQLRRSERLASLGTLAAGIAHEINNPLNTILLSADDALISDNPQEKDAALQTIKAESRRGGQIVRNILDFSREQKTDKRLHDLNELIRRAGDLVRTVVDQPGVSITPDLDPSIPPVLINPTEIEQVITNLIKNATEAAIGHVRIVLRTRKQQDKVCLTIQDDGPGIPREHLGRIFDPFFSTRVGSGGTGLGLSICHSIVTEHGGSIEVDSQPGQGAAFIIRLPIHVPPQTAP